MEKSKIEIIIDSVMDGTIGIEQVWQTYGDTIRNTKTVSSEAEVLALIGLYFRYGAKLEIDGYLKDAKEYYENAYQLIEKWKKHISDDQYNHAVEAVLHALANVNGKLEDYKSALPYLKQLKDLFPRKDDYRTAYINCLGSTIAKYTNPVYMEKPHAFDPRGRSYVDPRKRFYFDPLRALAGGVIFISPYLPALAALILRTLSPVSSI